MTIRPAHRTGVWLDHRRATLIELEGKEHLISHIDSGAEKQLSRTPSGDKFQSPETLTDPRDDRKERSFESDLLHYYENVVHALRHADAILLMGPGEAKGELHKRLEKDGLGKKIVHIQTTDHLTEPQIVQQVKQYYRENMLL